MKYKVPHTVKLKCIALRLHRVTNGILRSLYKSKEMQYKVMMKYEVLH